LRVASGFPDDRRVTLVERFTEVTRWSTARKTALLAGGIALPSLTLNLVIGHVILSRLDWFDLKWWDIVTGIWVLQTAVASVVAWLVVRTGAEGRWTYYVFGVPFAVTSSVAFYMMGANSTGFVAVLPFAALVVVVWYDDVIGRVVLWLTAAGLVAVEVVTVTGWLPYGPAVRNGDLAEQGGRGYTLMIAYLSSALCFVMLASVWLMVSAARLVSLRLDEAHQQLAESHQQLARANTLIARYVPAELAEDILAGRASETDGYARRKLTVFFSDLVGFTDIAEELEPEDLALVLNDYFSEMTAIAHRHHGTVDELQGDALLIIFGAPHEMDQHEQALSAVRMAAEMHEALAVLNSRWRDAGITETLVVRMGINTGVVTVGHFGSADRMKYAALGKHVNVAARLQSLCEPGRTVISYATWLLVKDTVECRPLGPKELKGINKPVGAFEVA
jgi:class 3 adenylate cyclase